MRVGCLPASEDEDSTLEGPVVLPVDLVSACFEGSGLEATTAAISDVWARGGREAAWEEIGRAPEREGARSRSEWLLEAEPVLERPAFGLLTASFEAAAIDVTDLIFVSVLLEGWPAGGAVLTSRYLRMVGVRGAVNLSTLEGSNNLYAPNISRPTLRTSAFASFAVARMSDSISLARLSLSMSGGLQHLRYAKAASAEINLMVADFSRRWLSK